MEQFKNKNEQISDIDIPKYERGVENIPTQEQEEVMPDTKIEKNNQEISNPELMEVFEEENKKPKKINPIKEIFTSKKGGPFNMERMRNNLKE